jgi:hypothetical protein
LKAEPHAQEHPTHRQAAQAQDGGEGQKISLRQVPETQPQALIEVGQDHRLADPETLEALVRAVEGHG